MGAGPHGGTSEDDSNARLESFRSKRALERRVRSYPLRGMRAVVLCALFWIVAGAAWNLGPVVLGACPTALWILAGLLVHGRLLALPELADELDRARANEGYRALASMLVLGLGFAAIALAHLAHWERGVDAWHPAYRGMYGYFDTWTLDPSAFVRLAGGSVATGQDVVVRLVAGTVATNLAEFIGHASRPLFFVGYALFVLGFYTAVRPREAGALRSTAWKVAVELGTLLFGVLVVLWVVAPIAAMKVESKLESVEREITVAEDPAVVAELLRIAFSEAALTIDVDQEISARDERSGDELAHGILLRAASNSPFVRWTTSFAGPLRVTPQVWATIASAGEAGTCTVLLRAGLYPVRSNEGESARAQLDELERALVTR